MLRLATEKCLACGRSPAAYATWHNDSKACGARARIEVLPSEGIY
jgi:hypothetical protein